MQILLNGEPRQVAPTASLAALIEAEALADRRIAVELNGQIVPRSTHPTVTLQPGDRVEVVHAIGGG
jgi:sulfur carrier protein